MNKLKLFAAAFATSSSIGYAEPVHAEAPVEPEDRTAFLKSGEASYYGEEVSIGRDKNGNRIYNPTSNGEKFNPWGMTAAFRDKSMFGDYVKVVAGKEEIIVRINDYGPFADDKNGNPRVIDLAHGAARELGMGGTAHVKIYACD